MTGKPKRLLSVWAGFYAEFSRYAQTDPIAVSDTARQRFCVAASEPA
ncbi:hypothetical protein [Treponema endosymbiont of Eucomonympha sp.]|nr:hypothetical protein [Treponema endosymbiont of Eucomonympha sp.]